MKSQLNPLAAGLALGILYAVCMLVCTVMAMQWGVAAKWADLMSDVYPWYEISMKGALVGMLWGFVDGFIAAYLGAWLYNVFAKKLGK